METTILIIEDEPRVASFIKKGLEVNNFDVDIAYDGESGVEKAIAKKYDLILLDISLPGIDGFEVCMQIRETHTLIPILMLTALGTTANKVLGFNLGADDYLLKPFEFAELLVRIKALMKRNQAGPADNVLRIANLEMDIKSKSVKRAGQKINLTQKEFMLLEYLLRNKEVVLSRESIAEKIWDITFDTGTNIIDLYIYYLRKKIDKNFSPKLIHTIIGMGYVLKTEDEQ